MSFPPPSGVELKHTNNGHENPKYIDLLEEDKPIAGQKFACLSFVSPEHILKQKDHFFFEKFLHYWDYQKSMEKFIQFLNFVSFKYHVNFDKKEIFIGTSLGRIVVISSETFDV